MLDLVQIEAPIEVDLINKVDEPEKNENKLHLNQIQFSDLLHYRQHGAQFFIIVTKMTFQKNSKCNFTAVRHLDSWLLNTFNFRYGIELVLFPFFFWEISFWRRLFEISTEEIE